jgi:hypothetical protein
MPCFLVGLTVDSESELSHDIRITGGSMKAICFSVNGKRV